MADETTVSDDTAKLPFFSDEMQLAGWSETHNGGCKVTFWVPSAEAMEPFKHMTIRSGNTSGQRVFAVFVQLNEQEEPMPAQAAARKSAHLGPLCGEAVGYCNRPAFVEWLTRGTNFASTSAGAREAMCKQLGISSRKDLDTDEKAALRWRDMKASYLRRQGFGSD